MGIQKSIGIGQEVVPRVVDFTLEFKRPAKTSRDVMAYHSIKYVFFEGPNGTAIGEYAPILGLSLDSINSFDQTFAEWKESENKADSAFWREKSSAFAFALDAANAHSHNQGFIPFEKIPINGLVWMNDTQTMFTEAKQLIDQQYNCIKLKVGALEWSQELDLVSKVRDYGGSNVIIRLDANGGFSPSEALEKLNVLAQFDIHSIEQPIAKGQWTELAELCRLSPIPIALDEELIGVIDKNKKIQLLEIVNPAFLVLKPSLHGGLGGCDEWIELADHYGIGWWVTSALESNIGLYAIASWLSKKKYIGHQGLGTGSLYMNNPTSPMVAKNGWLSYEKHLQWELDKLLEL
jgi:O-succinylbenzoate synthase